MKPRIIFSDVDGTLLNSSHHVLPGTLRAIKFVQKAGIPFVIISARSPSGIYPILSEGDFNCPIICYSGALILGEDRQVIYSTGLDKDTASAVISYAEKKNFDCTWNIYSMDQWIVKSKEDLRVIREENIVHAQALQGTVDLLPPDAKIGKVLFMCNPADTIEIEHQLKNAFPSLSIARSSDILLEVMPNGVTKRSAVEKLCFLWDIPVTDAAAFGDHYNDIEMLESVGMPFLMGNAPDELKSRFTRITDDNDHEGIFHALESIGLI